MNEFYNKMKYFEEVEKVDKEIYYHYTTIDALFYIVQSHTFRLTSLKTSNDAKELAYKSNDFINDFKCMIDTLEDGFTKDFCFWTIDSINSNEDAFKKECKIKGNSYSLCLSEKKDNLTHWDRYANGCKGVCIAINVGALQVLIKRNRTEMIGESLWQVGKILYDKSSRIESIRLYLKNIIRLFQKDDKSIDEIKNLVSHVGYRYAVSIYTLVSTMVKDSSFVDEDEVRIYHNNSSIKDSKELLDELLALRPKNEELSKNLNNNLKTLIGKTNIKEEKFYLSNKGIRAYKNLCLSDIWGSGVIEEIILGPQCIQNKKELQIFLKANGLEGVKVSISKVPIR